jgi:hypothetical protein
MGMDLYKLEDAYKKISPDIYNHGWSEAIDMVLSVISEMQDKFDNYTLDELRNRIV